MWVRVRGLSTLPAHLSRAQSEIKSGAARLLDVREVNEWRAAHFKSATLVPLSQLQAGVVPDDVFADQTARFYLHCAGGVRVHPAKAIMDNLGFIDVVVLGESMFELAHLQFDDVVSS